MSSMTPARTDTVPDFRLPSSTGQTLELDSFRGKLPLVLVFHPGLDHPGTDRIIADFDGLLAQFGAERCQVLVVLPETASDLRSYADEHDVSLPLLADPAHAMARAYEVLNDDGAVRPVLIVTDSDAVVVRRFDPAPDDGQADAALSAIRAQGSGALEPEKGSVAD